MHLIMSSSTDEELEVLRSIYEDLRTIPESYRHALKIETPLRAEQPLLFEFWFPEGYPIESGPSCSLAAPWLSKRSSVEQIKQQLHSIWSQKKDACIYDWIEWLREHSDEFAEKPIMITDSNIDMKEEYVIEEPSTPCPPILFGEPLLDRKSKFQAYIARVRSTDEVDAVVYQLRLDQKVASAAHPTILAYRLANPPHDNRDDDGETGAADKLLFLLHKLDLKDIVVVVTRWFGGILLGPDRFKHIMGRAKILLDQFKNDESIIPYASAVDENSSKSKSSAPSKQQQKAMRDAAFQGQWGNK